MKPFLRWTGGKTKLLPELRKHVPAGFTSYVEPFLGGGAMFFDLDLRGATDGVCLGDINAALMRTYAVLRGQLAEPTVELANFLIQEHNAWAVDNRPDMVTTRYKRLRELVTNPALGLVDQAAYFLYLNRASFNGLWRENKSGDMNTPCGSTTKLLRPWDPDQLAEAGRRLEGCHLVEGKSYEWFKGTAGPGTFIYLDPPYDVEPGAKSFTAYTSSTFNQDSQGRLADLVEVAVSRGAKVLVSNAGTSFIRSRYAEAGLGTVYEVTCSRGWRTQEHGAHAPEVVIRCGY